MSTYINVYKPRSKYTTLYLAICLVFCAVGAAGLVLDLAFDWSLIPTANFGTYIPLLGNGLISFFIVYDSGRKAKYFVAWDDGDISYLLPKSKTPEAIKIADITSVTFSRTHVLIGLRDNTQKEFNLSCFFFPDRKRIVDFFESIDQKLAG
jgi:hypothetical protein